MFLEEYRVLQGYKNGGRCSPRTKQDFFGRLIKWALLGGNPMKLAPSTPLEEGPLVQGGGTW